MAMILNEKEICEYLGIPSIPKKKWDGKSSFKRGVGIVDLLLGGQSYAVVSFDAEKDKDCKVVKVFNMEQFKLGFDNVFVVPDYMDTDVETMDLDEESKRAARTLVDEVKDLENSDDVSAKVELPENEFYFPNVTCDDEGIAYIKSYNIANKIKGSIPTTHEGIVMRLSVIYSELNNKSPKSKSRKKK